MSSSSSGVSSDGEEFCGIELPHAVCKSNRESREAVRASRQQTNASNRPQTAAARSESREGRAIMGYRRYPDWLARRARGRWWFNAGVSYRRMGRSQDARERTQEEIDRRSTIRKPRIARRSSHPHPRRNAARVESASPVIAPENQMQPSGGRIPKKSVFPADILPPNQYASSRQAPAIKPERARCTRRLRSSSSMGSNRSLKPSSSTPETTAAAAAAVSPCATSRCSISGTLRPSLKEARTCSTAQSGGGWESEGSFTIERAAGGSRGAAGAAGVGVTPEAD